LKRHRDGETDSDLHCAETYNYFSDSLCNEFWSARARKSLPPNDDNFFVVFTYGEAFLVLIGFTYMQGGDSEFFPAFLWTILWVLLLGVISTVCVRAGTGVPAMIFGGVSFIGSSLFGVGRNVLCGQLQIELSGEQVDHGPEVSD
jgi:hypothetical protein